MDETQIRALILQVLQEYMSKGQYTTTPVQVHTHTGRGNDAPQIPFLGMKDTPNSYHGQAGKAATVNATETGLHFASASGASATPGGNNKDVQFNDAGVFGGVDEFTFDKATNTLSVGTTGNGFIQSSGGILALTAESDVQINTPIAGGVEGAQISISTNSINVLSSNTGEIFISSGNAFGVGKSSGELFLATGNGQGGASSGILQISTSPAPAATTGEIDIFTGDSSSGGTSGNMQIFTGGGSGPGSIFMFVNNADSGVTGGTIDIEAGFTNQFGGNGNGGDLILGSGAGQGTGVNGRVRIPRGVIFIANETAPSDTPSGGGYLYVISGALKYKGSSGTVTPLAPA